MAAARSGVQAAAGHFGRNAVSGTDAGDAGVIGRGDENQSVAALFKRRADDDRTVHKGELRPCLFGVRQRSVDAAQNLRLGDGRQPGCALRRCKGAVRQQTAAHFAVFIGYIRPERCLQLRDAGRARQQDLPRHKICIHTRIPLCAQKTCRTGFAAAGTTGNAYNLHSSTTRNAAARIRRL